MSIKHHFKLISLSSIISMSSFTVDAGETFEFQLAAITSNAWEPGSDSTLTLTCGNSKTIKITTVKGVGIAHADYVEIDCNESDFRATAKGKCEEKLENEKAKEISKAEKAAKAECESKLATKLKNKPKCIQAAQDACPEHPCLPHLTPEEPSCETSGTIEWDSNGFTAPYFYISKDSGERVCTQSCTAQARHENKATGQSLCKIYGKAKFDWTCSKDIDCN